MRLLDVKNCTLTEHQSSLLRYAILSHRWGDEEVTLQDMQSGQAASKKGYKKITGLCQKAAEEGFEYAWIDTCCIDKTSSSELSESINSMYLWYQMSDVCYVSMADVDGAEDPATPGSSFRKSGWFTRGWTLQELLAPRNVIFYDRDWSDIGTKKSLAAVIEEITTIDRSVLIRNYPSEVSVARRLSWAARRETTRVEDRAYSLMGLFGVNMPAIYGEGPKAFLRLQQEIIKVSNDHSIFAWRGPSYSPTGLLASSPEQFQDSGFYHGLSYEHFVEKFRIRTPQPSYSVTNFGVNIQLPLQRVGRGTVIAYLSACHEHGGRILGIYLTERENHPQGHYRRTRTQDIVHADDIDNSIITTESIFVAEENPTMFSSIEYKNQPRPEKYMFTLKLAGPHNFALADYHPRDYWQASGQPVMNLPNSGEYATAVFRNIKTGKAFAVILGAHNWQAWIDIRVVDDRKESAEWVYEWYRYDNPQDNCGYVRRWDALDRVKKPMSSGKHVVLSVREESIMAGQGIYAVHIAVEGGKQSAKKRSS